MKRWISTSEDSRKNIGQYGYFILSDVRRNLGLDKDDDSMDDVINEMSQKEVLERFLTWRGIMGWSDTILRAIDDIYGTNFRE